MSHITIHIMKTNSTKDTLASKLAEDLDFLVENAARAVYLIRTSFRPLIEGLITLLDNQDFLIYPDAQITAKLDEV